MKTRTASNTAQIALVALLLLACLAACQKPSHELAIALIIVGGTGSVCCAAWCFRQLLK